LLSRIIEYQEVYNKLGTNLSNILFGSGVVPSRQLFIDNDFLYVYSNVGLVMYILIQVLYLCILFKGLNGIVNNKYSTSFIKGLIIFLVTYPFASIISTVVYIYFPLAILAFLLMKNIEGQNSYC
jgi:hypothetical protein